MDYFTPHTFTLPALNGISQKNVDEHLKLYAGYVKFANYIQKQLAELSKDVEKNAYEIGELQRRFAFEYDGMRNHELFFAQFEGGAQALAADSAIMTAITTEWGSYEAFITRFTTLATTRGIGWAMLYWDKESKHLLLQWVDEQHLGHLQGLRPLLVLDMWEHAFVYDYTTSEKKKYIEAFFNNLNWQKVTERFLTL